MSNRATSTKPAPSRGQRRQPDPTPEEIAACCRAIQAGWSPRQRRQRCLATSKTAQRMLRELAEQILPPPPQIIGAERLAALARVSSARRSLVPSRPSA